METSKARELAEKHCAFIEGLLATTKEPMTAREKYLFVEGMVHMNKHNQQEETDG